MGSYLVNDDVPPPLAGGPQHLLEAPSCLLDNQLPLPGVVLLAWLTIHLSIEKILGARHLLQLIRLPEALSGVIHRSLKNNVSINFNINVYEKILF